MAIAPGPDDRVYSAAKLVAVLAALVADGISAEVALAGSGLKPAILNSPKTRVSLTQILTVYGNALRLAADPLFAFRVGSGFHISTYGLYGFGILSGTDFRQMTSFVTTYHQLAAPLIEIGFSEAGGIAAWTVAPIAHPLANPQLSRFIIEFQFGLQQALHRDVMGFGFAFDELHVTWPEPPSAAAYARALGCRVRFTQPADRFLFKSSWLDTPPALGNALAYAEIVELCDAQLRRIGLGVGIAGQVRHLLLVSLMRPIGVEEVAAELGVSARTLRRRLAAEGTSFRELLDELRRDMAVRYLEDDRRSVEQIAFALGFSDAANFRHAFRRWTDASPRHFRSQAQRVLGAGDNA